MRSLPGMENSVFAADLSGLSEVRPLGQVTPAAFMSSAPDSLPFREPEGATVSGFDPGDAASPYDSLRAAIVIDDAGNLSLAPGSVVTGLSVNGLFPVNGGWLDLSDLTHWQKQAYPGAEHQWLPLNAQILDALLA